MLTLLTFCKIGRCVKNAKDTTVTQCDTNLFQNQIGSEKLHVFNFDISAVIAQSTQDYFFPCGIFMIIYFSPKQNLFFFIKKENYLNPDVN